MRFAGASMGASWLHARPVRILPHVVDSILLLSALLLAVSIAANPLQQAWLLTKILALFVYIALGMVALNESRGPRLRMVSGLAALGVFAYIVSVALSKNVAGFLAGIAS